MCVRSYNLLCACVWCVIALCPETLEQCGPSAGCYVLCTLFRFASAEVFHSQQTISMNEAACWSHRRVQSSQSWNSTVSSPVLRPGGQHYLIKLLHSFEITLHLLLHHPLLNVFLPHHLYGAVLWVSTQLSFYILLLSLKNSFVSFVNCEYHWVGQ